MSGAQDSGGVSRRAFMGKTVGATAGVATAIGAADQADVEVVGGAEAIAPLAVVGVAAGGAALGYLGHEAADAILGDNRDYSGYTGADALHTAIYEGAIEMRSTDERVMTSIENSIEFSRNVALAKGKAAIIETMNAGGSESEANTALQDALDAYFSTIQKNLLNHHHAQLDQYLHYVQSVKNHDSITESEVFEMWQGAGSSGGFQQEGPLDLSLVDGSTVDYRYLSGLDGSGSRFHYDPLGLGGHSQTSNRATINDYDTGDENGDSNQVALTRKSWADSNTDPNENGAAWNDLLWIRDDVLAELSGFVGDVYAQWDPGEIPTEQLVDPITAATELQQNYDGYQTQGAMAAMLGIPTSAEQSLYLHLLDDDQKVWADIYTNHDPGSDGFQRGETYSPSTWSEPLYIAYEYQNDQGETSTDFTQVEQDFKIEDAYDAETGDQIDSFRPTSQNAQTSDVSAIQEELEQIRQYQQEMQEDAQEQGGGGGLFNGGLLGNLGTEAVMVGGAAAGLFVLVLAALTSGFATDEDPRKRA